MNWFLDRKIDSFEQHMAHTVTVPGALRAWETMLNRFGTRDFKTLFADAISYGKKGFVVAPRVARDWATLVTHIKQNEAATEQLLVGGRAPVAGEKFALPKLASTLERVAKQDSSAFYTGEIAEEIAQSVQESGGLLSQDDLGDVSADWVTPISTNYRGYDCHEIPPAGQGITALVLLNILQKLGAHSLPADSVERLHMEIEAARLAYGVRDAYVSDPTTMSARVEQILSDAHTYELAQMFDPARRNSNISLPPLPRSDTIYLCVVDKDRQAVSFINSLYQGFGSGIVTPNSGICLQNRGAGFSLQAGHDNALAGGKRPLHTIIPAMVTKNGALVGPFGVMGGAYQPLGHAHVLSNMVDYGMDPQQALDHGRVFWGKDDVLEVELGVTEAARAGLSALGHTVRPAIAPWGGGQIIHVDGQSGALIGGSDGRKDGMAAGY